MRMSCTQIDTWALQNELDYHEIKKQNYLLQSEGSSAHVSGYFVQTSSVSRRWVPRFLFQLRRDVDVCDFSRKCLVSSHPPPRRTPPLVGGHVSLNGWSLSGRRTSSWCKDFFCARGKYPRTARRRGSCLRCFALTDVHEGAICCYIYPNLPSPIITLRHKLLIFCYLALAFFFGVFFFVVVGFIANCCEFPAEARGLWRKTGERD